MDKIRVGVIGTGFATSVHVPGFQALPDYEVVAVTSARRERAEEAAARFGIANAFTDYRRMLEVPDLDLVSVVTPPVLHHEMTLAALAAGKHVLCEKPLAMNVSQAGEMLERAETAQRVHMVTHEFRFAPARQYAKQLIDEGYIGKLGHAQVSVFVRWRGPTPRNWSWASDPAQGGSWLGALGSHFIDTLLFWFGPMAEVSGSLSVLEPDHLDAATGEIRQSTADDTFSFTARFQSGGEATVASSSAVQVGASSRIEIYGTQGTLVLDQGLSMNPPTYGKLLGRRRGDDEVHELPVPASYFPYEVEGDARLWQFVALIRELARGIRDGGPVAPSFREGLRVQEVLDTVRKSAESRRWESVSS